MEGESNFWVHIEKHRRWRVQIFFANMNTKPCWIDPNVCTKDDLTKEKDVLNQIYVIESCSREKMNTKWRLCKLTNLTAFAALLKDVPMCCKHAVSPEPLFENH